MYCGKSSHGWTASSALSVVRNHQSRSPGQALVAPVRAQEGVHGRIRHAAQLGGGDAAGAQSGAELQGAGEQGEEVFGGLLRVTLAQAAGE